VIMGKRVSVTLALAIVLAAGLAAFLVGAEVRPSSGHDQRLAVERLLARATVSPKLPTYEPGSGWPKLPTEPPPVVTEPEGSGTEEAGSYVSSETVTSGSEGEEGSRPYGITFGK